MRNIVLRALLVGLLALAGAARAQDPLTKQALGRIEQYEKLEPSLKEGDTQAASLYLNALAWAGKRLNAVANKNEPTWKDAEARYKALWAKIDAKGTATAAPTSAGYDHGALTQLDKEIANAHANLRMLSAKHLADESRSRGFRDQIAEFEARLEKFPPSDENMEIVTANLASLEKLFEAGMSQLAQGESRKAGAESGLAALGAKYESRNKPENLSHPFDEQQVRAWAAEMRRWREVELPQDVAWLDDVRENPVVDQQKVNSLRSWLTGSWRWRLDDVEKLVRERVASDVEVAVGHARFVLETDAGDENHVLGRILGKGAFDENMRLLRDGQHAVAIARVYDDAMGSPAVMGPTITDSNAPPPAQPDRDAQATKIERAIAHLNKLAVKALDAVRMPQAASTDPELLAIAAETLAKPDYGVGERRRLVINQDKTRKMRREAWIRPGAAYATLSYYEYVWDEFQVTTAETVGDQIWLYSNLLKRFESGDPTSPIGRWVLSRRFELTPIRPENVDR